ncbi:haloacid dehalogenase superfamily enzyme, subfamily IA [Salinarchaeum sp. Harcht-Bsk1]|uniref:HAD family hydrolase n=1 Tax=Salinarchaeum sp. Harcht-Bsk1 TaxID=1333523 RepID=UPI00034238DD|nr:HAD family hydrolase [Salinarchaeum sp. Harcht-Bsk1]AGN01635.1 haloacid dehalogenase superfamily enzyme, subfamily IA [Salinarchaeum sp. Harcht-Bsk1]
MGYDAVVFDNDGVLVEPTDWDVIRAAIREAFNEVGVVEPADEHVERLIGVTVDDVHAVADAYDLDPHELWEARDTAGSRHQSELVRNGGKSLFPDVAALSRISRPMGVVSNNQHATVETIVDHYELEEHFDVVYGRQPTIEDVANKKPEPFYLNKALDEIGVEDAIYVGDSVKDIEVARRVGVDAAFVRRSHNDGVELPHEPELEVSDLERLADAIE